jgi:CRISPR-associated protein Csm1
MPVLYRWDEPPSIDREKYVRIGRRFLQPAAGVLGKGKEEVVGTATAVYHLNDWDLTHFTHAGSRPLLAGVYLPGDEECRDLAGMAGSGLGIERIGVLRMDVDYLGRIFSRCMPSGERTLSRMASLSRQLSLFFKFHINGLLAGKTGYPETMRVSREWKKERLVSVVYSGGDDLFLIGHWLDVTEAAFDIEAAFGAFTGNPSITLSAGMTLGGTHDPVYRLAEKAGDAESAAKGGDKRSLTVFDRHTFTWTDARSILDLVQILEGFGVLRESRIHLSEESLSRGFFYRLLQLVREHNRAMRQSGKSKIWLLPKLAYAFGRCQPRATQLDAFQALKNYVFSSEVDWLRLEVALLWFLMMMRQGG